MEKSESEQEEEDGSRHGRLWRVATGKGFIKGANISRITKAKLLTVEERSYKHRKGET